ncbi:glycosyltransferase [Algoriphagus lutimaris]|uniref:glycosyltransferase n=1 Tax=Algoriphagus lutimaris TaxID=613197 RepID=UPI00196A4FF2|nr:glycosyltransferase [Algoriphagus lutimaris]MBN3518781.1 glycosyltransferase [Algoriphagus lutimaris]
MTRICIDVTNIVPGLGGAGGGISTYSKNLISGIDQLLDSTEEGVEMMVIGHPDFLKKIEIKNMTVEYKVVNNQSFFSRFYWLNFSLPRFLKERQVDILHRVIPELPIFPNTKSMFTLHDFMFDFYLSNERLGKYLGFKEKLKFRVLRWLMQSGLKKGNMVLVPSGSIANELKRRFPKKDLTIKVTKLATAFEGLDKKDSLNLEENSEIKIGYIAGFYPHKGHKKAISLMKMLVNQQRGKSFKLFFRGSVVYPEYYEEIKDLVVKENLQEVIFFEEFEPSITIKEIYEKYDVTLLLSEYEGFGLPVLESQAFLKPVLCSDIPVFRENLNGSAFFIQEEIKESEVERVLNALSDTAFLQSLSQEGMKNSSQYRWENTCRKTLASYLNFA